MNDGFMEQMNVVKRTDAALFGKYQRLLGDKERAARAYEALLTDTEYVRTVHAFLHDPYCMVIERLTKTSSILNNLGINARSEAKKHTSAGDNPLARKFDMLSRKLFEQADSVRQIRNGIQTELNIVYREYRKAADDLTVAFEQTIICDNKYIEYCQWIENRLHDVLKQGESL